MNSVIQSHAKCPDLMSGPLRVNKDLYLFEACFESGTPISLSSVSTHLDSRRFFVASHKLCVGFVTDIGLIVSIR
jgi:hypothetical protein